MGIPDGVFLQAVQVHPLAVPCGGCVHTGLITLRLDFLTKRNGALGAVGDAQTVGTAGAVGGSGSFGVKEDRIVQFAAVQHIGAGKGFFLCLGLSGSLTEEIDTHLQARVLRVGKMFLKHGVQHQIACRAVAAVADADDNKADTGLFDLGPVNILLVFGHIDAEGRAVLQHAVIIKIIQFSIHRLDALDRLVCGLAIIIGLAIGGAPAGVDRGGVLLFLQPAEQEIEQPAEKSVFIAQVDALRLGSVQRTGVQCLPDLFRRQHHTVFRRMLVGTVLLGFRSLHRRGQRVLCGQRRRFRLQGGHGRFKLLLRHCCGRAAGRFGLCSQRQRRSHRKSHCHGQHCRRAPHLAAGAMGREFVPEYVLHATFLRLQTLCMFLSVCRPAKVGISCF